jgi:hypothetical protein
VNVKAAAYSYNQYGIVVSSLLIVSSRRRFSSHLLKDSMTQLSKSQFPPVLSR